MRKRALFALFSLASCTGVTYRPQVTERKGIDPVYLAMYSAAFEVACDSCRVEYGREGETYHDVVDGGWSRSVSLGTLRSGQSVRVRLRVVPVEGSRVLSAHIEAEGRVLASSEDKKPGQVVELSARVRAR